MRRGEERGDRVRSETLSGTGVWVSSLYVSKTLNAKFLYTSRGRGGRRIPSRRVSLSGSGGIICLVDQCRGECFGFIFGFTSTVGDRLSKTLASLAPVSLT